MRFVCILALALLIHSSLLSQNDSLLTAPAINEMLHTTSGDSLSWREVIQNGDGYVQVIDVWATWCKDCIVGFPDLKNLQKQYKGKKVKFVFLSLDKTKERWQQGIDYYKLEGDHYYVKRGWKGELCSSMNLDWIPRYIILSPEGKISLFRAIKSTDPLLAKTIDDILK